MKKKSGFTLVEILVSIMIISILITFVTISIINLYKNGKKGIFEDNVLGSFKEVEYYLYKNNYMLPSEGLSINDLELSSKKFISGKFERDENNNLVAIKISDGEFCAYGTKINLTIEDNCLDKTIPTLNLIVYNKTTNSITVIAETLPENEIAKYEFKIDENSNYNLGTNKMYTFNNLTQGEYKIYAKVTNTGGLSSEKVITVSTNPLDDIKPEIRVVPTSGWAKSKTATIIYPERKEGYVFSYIIDDELPVIVQENTVTLEFNKNGSIYAKVFDETNYASKSYVIGQIDNEGPIISGITININNISFSGFNITRSGNAVDNGVGLAVKPYKYQISTDNNNWTTSCTSNEVNCSISGIDPLKTYYYRLCVVDDLGNESCTEYKTKSAIDENYCKTNTCSLLSEKIISDNTVQSDSGLNFGAISSESNGRGVYYRITNNETNCVSGAITYVNSGVCRSYYYRGDVTNNYVYFAGFYWRIIRINEDGSLRMIYAGTTPSATGVNATIGDVLFNNVILEPYVGYMYNTSGIQTTMTTSSSSSLAKQSVDSWYLNNLNSYSSYISKNTLFCTDRYNLGTTANGNFRFTTYGANARIYSSKNPKFACTQSNDRLTSTTSTSIGMKVMQYPAGMITVDEVAFAGGVYDTVNSDYYLKINKAYYTISPSGYIINTTLGAYSTNFFAVDSENAIQEFGIFETWTGIGKYPQGIRPVISLKSCVKTMGTGTNTDPYRIFLDNTCPSSNY